MPTTIMGPILDTIVVSHAVVVGVMCEEAGRHVNMGLLHLLLCLVSTHCFTSSVVTPQGHKSRRSPLRMPTSSYIVRYSLLTSFPMPEKKVRERRKRKGDYWDLQSVASPSLSSYGETRFDPLQGNAGSPIKPCEPRVYVTPHLKQGWLVITRIITGCYYRSNNA
jgi:hypothetical protein